MKLPLNNIIILFWIIPVVCFAQSNRGTPRENLIDQLWSHYQLHQFDSILIKCDEILNAPREGSDDSFLSDIYSLLGNSYRQLQLPERAIYYHERALALRKRAGKTKLLEAGNSLFNIGNCLQDIGRLEEAMKYYRAAEETRNNSNLLPTDVSRAIMLNSIGFLLLQQNKPEQALSEFNIAIDILKTADQEHPQLVPVYINLAGFYEKTEDFINAWEILEKALKINQLRNETVGGQNVTADIISNQADLLVKRDSSAAAMQYYKMSIDILEDLPKTSSNQRLAGKNFNNLGNIYLERLDIASAIEAYEKSRIAFKSLTSLVHTSLPSVLNHLAICYRYRNQYKRSKDLLDQALEFYKSGAIQNPEVKAEIYNNLAVVYFEQDSLEQCLQYIIMALHTEKLYALKGATCVQSLIIQGDLYLKDGNLDRAEATFQSALLATRDIEKPSSALKVSILVGLGKTGLEKGEFKIAEKLAKEAVLLLDGGPIYTGTSLEANLLLARISEKKARSKEDWLLAFYRYRQALEIQRGIANYFEHIESVIFFRDRLKSLYDGIIRANIELSVYNADYQLLAFKYSNLFQNGYSRANLTGRNNWGNPDNKFQPLGKLGEIVNKPDLIYFEKHLIREIEHVKTIVLEFQAHLVSNVPTIKYYLDEEMIYKWVIGRDSIFFHQNEKSPVFDSILISYYRLLSTDRKWRPNRTQENKDWARSSYFLYQALLAPIERYFTEGATITIIPDGLLTFLPFEAFISSVPEQPNLFKQYPYLVYRYSFRYQPSFLNWPANESKNSKKWRKGILGVAPSFSGRVSEISPLEYNDDEVTKIVEILGGRLLVGDTITKIQIRELLKEYPVAHFSTHGYLDPVEPEHSHLLLSELDRRQSLIFDSIKYLDIETDLVVLSACETGIGKFYFGEGALSLARPFLLAGAKSTITSLWSVDDKRTADLFVEFYQRNNIPKDQALRKAKIQMITGSTAQKYAHPYYWASFVLSGDIKPVKSAFGERFPRWYFIGLFFILCTGILIFTYSRKKQLQHTSGDSNKQRKFNNIF